MSSIRWGLLDEHQPRQERYERAQLMQLYANRHTELVAQMNAPHNGIEYHVHVSFFFILSFCSFWSRPRSCWPRRRCVFVGQGRGGGGGVEPGLCFKALEAKAKRRGKAGAAIAQVLFFTHNRQSQFPSNICMCRQLPR